MADARRVDFLKYGGRGAPTAVGISGVRKGVGELLQAVYTTVLGRPICCGFAAVLKLNFGIPNLGERELL